MTNSLIEKAILTCLEKTSLTDVQLSLAYSVSVEYVKNLRNGSQKMSGKTHYFGPEICESKKANIIEAYNKGKSAKDIAQMVGVSIKTVYKYIHLHNGTYKKPARKVVWGEKSKYGHLRSQVLKLAEQGDLAVEIAEKLSVHTSIISQMARGMGINLRKYSEHIQDFYKRDLYFKKSA